MADNSEYAEMQFSPKLPYGFRYPIWPQSDGSVAEDEKFKFDLDTDRVYDKNYSNHGLLKLLRYTFSSIDDNSHSLAFMFKAQSYGKHDLPAKDKAHGEHSMLRWCYELIENEMKNSIPGEIFEFGCFTGISSAKISIASSFCVKNLYVFDSFEGLPDPKKYGSGEQKSYYEPGEYSSSFESVRFNLSTHGLEKGVTLVKGFFETSIPEFKNYDPDMKISYAFIDVDLSKSIEECLEYVIPRLSPGGMIFMDELADKDNLSIFEKFGFFDPAKFEIRSICAKTGNIKDGATRPEDHHNCGIIKKIS